MLILNNGVRQEGQQWGQDHAPEIDPFTASEISVIKGPASLRYGSDAIGGVILLDPKKLPDTACIHADVNLVGATNNRMGTTSGELEGAFDKGLKGLSWRVQGTLKRPVIQGLLDIILIIQVFPKPIFPPHLLIKRKITGLIYIIVNTQHK